MWTRKILAGGLILGFLAGSAPTALADIFDRDLDLFERERFVRDVDLDRDDVLLALALGGDVRDVADVRIGRSVVREFDRDFGFGRDDALLALALGGRGAFGDRLLISRDPFDRDFGRSGFFDLDRGFGRSGLFDRDLRTIERVRLDRDVDLDRRDALFGLALGLDLEDVADVRLARDVSRVSRSDVGFDRGDLFGALLLGGL